MLKTRRRLEPPTTGWQTPLEVFPGFIKIKRSKIETTTLCGNNPISTLAGLKQKIVRQENRKLNSFQENKIACQTFKLVRTMNL